MSARLVVLDDKRPGRPTIPDPGVLCATKRRGPSLSIVQQVSAVSRQCGGRQGTGREHHGRTRSRDIPARHSLLVARTRRHALLRSQQACHDSRMVVYKIVRQGQVYGQGHVRRGLHQTPGTLRSHTTTTSASRSVIITKPQCPSLQVGFSSETQIRHAGRRSRNWRCGAFYYYRLATHAAVPE